MTGAEDCGTSPRVPGRPNGAASPLSLHEVLDEARTAGFLGPGSLDLHIRHGEGFVEVARDLAVSGPVGGSAPSGASRPRLVDLGSGGGVPGLVVARAWPEVELVLLEASRRRCAFLRRAIERLGVQNRVRVLEGRAEEFGRDPALRSSFDGAFARSFGRPAVVAECAAPLLRPGAWLLVSEPPGSTRSGTPTASTLPAQADETRWPAERLRPLGLDLGPVVYAGFDYQVLRQVAACPERFPRRNGVPSKRPLF